MMNQSRIRRKTRELKSNARSYGWTFLISVLALVVILVLLQTLAVGATIIYSVGVVSAILIGGAGYFVINKMISFAGSQLLAPEKATPQAKLGVSEGKFKALIQHSLDVVTILDSKGNIQYMSPSTERVLGYVPDSLLTQPMFDLIHEEDKALMHNALGQKTTFFFSFRVQHHDGSWLWFESAGTNMLQDPSIRGIVLNMRDITDRKREEEAKKQKEMAAIRFNLEKEKAENEKRIIEEGKKQLEEAYAIIEHKNHEIHDSITYAFRIQKAMLPEDSVIRQYLPNSFIFFRPKDIVSGDFYWFAQQGHYSLIAAADCTGHGVPGAFMTMIGNTLLNQVVKQQGAILPDQILNNLHLAVRRALRQDEVGSTSRDGMDISFLVIDHESRKVHWAGANNPLVQITGGQAIEHKADKYAIGGMQTEDQRIFTLLTLPYQDGDVFYIYSDGFQDQFGGDRGRKYMTKRFKELLFQLHTLPPKDQEQSLDAEFKNWIGDRFEQIDDVLVVGIKL